MEDASEAVEVKNLYRFAHVWQLEPAVVVEQQLENVRSAIARNLHEVRACKAHHCALEVAAGGPSLFDTWDLLSGRHIAAVNGTLEFLLQRNIVPWCCAVLDPGPHMVDIVPARDDVVYFVASVCDPSLFEKLANCRVHLWHPSGLPGLDELLAEANGGRTVLQIGGGSTMGVRWLNLGYVLGFRRFVFHGLDSSFRGNATHAYPDRQDDRTDRIVVDGRVTRRNFLAQVHDFKAVLRRFSMPDIDRVSIQVRGDGLLQDQWHKYQQEHPQAFRAC